jgi:hypothetical protein
MYAFDYYNCAVLQKDAAKWLDAIFYEAGHFGEFIRNQRAAAGAPLFDQLALSCADHFACTLERMQITGIAVERSAIRNKWCSCIEVLASGQ